MFASTEIVNPKPRFSFPSSLPLLNTHQDLLLDHHSLFLPADNSNGVQVIHETLILGDMDMGGGVSKLCALTSGSSSPPARSSSKKDRHSKIRTSQGLRDRRVRLSIGIAREFFDLQDMLGFDTASKTLDWLLSNSKKSIGELAKAKHGSSASAAFNCHVAPGDPELEEVNTPETSITKSQKLGFSKETRAKARARARERAREKICSDSPAGKNNQSSSAAMSSSTSTSATSQSQVKSSQRLSPSQTNNDFYFPNLAQDWDITYNSVLHPSNNMNLSATAGLLFTENMYQPTVT